MNIIIFVGITFETSDTIFYVLHPLRIVLSALVTTAMYRRYRGSVAMAVGIGFVGSIAIGSISDIFFPYIGGVLLGLPITLHISLIEHTWLITLSALAGIAIGLSWSRTKVPHAGHVLTSTYASLFYLTTFVAPADWLPLLPLIFPILFVAVWIPCCVSDIVFPLLFVRGGRRTKSGS